MDKFSARVIYSDTKILMCDLILMIRFGNSKLAKKTLYL